MEKISVFEIFKIGIGPSSSHSMGPWNAAKDFLHLIEKNNEELNNVKSIDVQLYGSLAKTGKGHGTDKAIMMGLMGYDIETFKTELLEKNIKNIVLEKEISLLNKIKVPFDPNQNIHFNFIKKDLKHANTMDFRARFKSGEKKTYTYYSIGGGFIKREGSLDKKSRKSEIPFPIQKAEEILKWCTKENKSLSEISLENELCWRNHNDIIASLDNIWKVMIESIYLGCISEGELPGGLNVKRRASQISQNLLNDDHSSIDEWIDLIMKQNHDMENVTNWISCFALAVNEVNASYGRIVTAPTNGAAGVIPAVLMYYFCFKGKNEKKPIRDFLLVAGEIGMLFKKGATISAAAGGCQAEIGVSSAMAAGALAFVSGANTRQVLMAAEIAMEHHLGLSCDPIGGLVQIPCIERNTMGAMKAITAAQLALKSDPKDAIVSLDDVIKTMWETGKDMMSKYKETSEGGLAIQVSVNQPEC
jgi:L-serine dehydratase